MNSFLHSATAVVDLQYLSMLKKKLSQHRTIKRRLRQSKYRVHLNLQNIYIIKNRKARFDCKKNDLKQSEHF